MKLAEAGHEVAQMNLAQLLDAGSSMLLLNGSNASEPSEEARAVGRVHAQRHYEMSAEQGNAFSELRLGDYAYYGWGLRVDEGPEDEDWLAAADEEALAEADALRLVRQEADIGLSLAHYRRTANMRVTGEWMQPFVARALFNLGYMHQFGVGVEPSTPLARRYYNRCLEVDPGGVQAPVMLMLVLLSLQALLSELPAADALADALLGDLRTHVLLVLLGALALLLHLRGRAARAVV